MPSDEKENRVKAEDTKKANENKKSDSDKKEVPPPQIFKTDNLLNFALKASKESDKKDEKKKQED